MAIFGILRAFSVVFMFCFQRNTYLAIVSIETLLDGLKLFKGGGFSHVVQHLYTKFQPLKLKDAENIGWCG